MINKYLLRTLAALALAFVITISSSSHAQAAAPNSLLVLTGYQPYGGSVTPAVGVGGIATVVGKKTSNGITIPLSYYPYYGNHLDTNINGSPDTNSTLWGTDGNFYGYSFQSRKYLIWCGNSGGVPDGEFQVDVNLAFQNSQSGGYASATELNVGGVIKKGHWAGEWWRQGEDGETWVGFSTYFNGQNARIVALNPGLMVVKFTFIEDAPPPPPPPPTYLGQIQTLKYDTATGVLATDQSMKNARTYIEPCGGSATCSNVGLNNWLTGVYMWVYQGGPGIGNGVQNIHSSKIVVPYGYRVNKVRLNLNTSPVTDVTPTTTADGKLTCDGSNNTGTCSIGTKVWNNNTTFVDWYLEKILPTLNVTCTSDNGAIGGYITVTASSNIPGGTNTVAIKGDTDINPPATPQNITGSYTFDITSKYRDGGVHTYYATYDGLSKSVAFGPGQTCNIDKWFYPWLQTSQGDVVADGKIEGQTTSTGTAGTLGARLDSTTAKEAEFLVISAVAGGGPFCSTYKYILTNTSSQGTNCGNGTGYNFNSTGIDNDTVDRVIGGVKQAFADNGNNANPTPSACSANGIATATVTAMPASISTDCIGGVIYKLSSSTLVVTTPTKGRATIFVDGDLTITGNISSASSLAQADPRLAPTLAIVVTGNINIASTVSSIYAQLYSAKKINTCTTSTGTPTTTNDCSLKRLVVVGSLSAKTGFEFKRTFVDTAYQNSAEQIKLTGNSIVIPPPGIDSRYFYNNFSSYKLDSAEYNPRF